MLTGHGTWRKLLRLSRGMMKRLKVQASWFPWVVYCLAFLYSVGSIEPQALFQSADYASLFISILAVLWLERYAVVSSLAGEGTGSSIVGWMLFITGCLLFILGYVVGALKLYVWGLFLIPAGLVGVFASREHGESSRFIAFAGSVVVIMGLLITMVLSSRLAIGIATVSASLLNTLSIPVVADGVALYFGPYSAEVTEGCSGMRSLFALAALSVVYLKDGTNRRPWHSVVLVLCVLPVAILANLGRVILLVLVTLFIGDDFAQGLFHDVAGITAFVLALFLLYGTDRLLALLFIRHNKTA